MERGLRPRRHAVVAPAAARPEVAGRRFVLTGSLSQPRPDIAARIAAAGGKVSASVSAKTDYLVAGEAAGAKLKQAERLGVTVLDEAGLTRLLAD